MIANKGDLVLVSNGDLVSTCIILSVRYTYQFQDTSEFYYTYCLETGLYGIVYDYEIINIVSKNFAPEFEFESELFDTNYSYYDAFYDSYLYWPYYCKGLNKELEDDSTEEIEIDEPDKKKSDDTE